MAKIKNKSSVELLLGYLLHLPEESYLEKSLLAMVFGEIGDKRATGALIELLLETDEDHVKVMAAEALGNIGDSKAINALLSILEKGREQDYIKKAVAWALSRLWHFDENKIAPPLLSYLETTGILDTLGSNYPSEGNQ